jgi:hypothetical protein
MDAKCGLLTMTTGHNTTASGLANALLESIDRLATPRVRHKRVNTFRSPPTHPTLDKDLADKIRHAIFAFAADKASDEQLAERLLQLGSGRVTSARGAPVPVA